MVSARRRLWNMMTHLELGYANVWSGGLVESHVYESWRGCFEATERPDECLDSRVDMIFYIPHPHARPIWLYIKCGNSSVIVLFLSRFPVLIRCLWACVVARESAGNLWHVLVNCYAANHNDSIVLQVGSITPVILVEKGFLRTHTSLVSSTFEALWKRFQTLTFAASGGQLDTVGVTSACVWLCVVVCAADS